MVAILASRHPQRLLVAYIVAGLAFGLVVRTLVGRRRPSRAGRWRPRRFRLLAAVVVLPLVN